MALYDTAELVDTVKRHAGLSTSIATGASSAFTDNQILSFASEEQSAMVTPIILSTFGEHYVREEIIPITTSTIRIPTRAIASRVRDIVYIDTSGTVWNVPEMSPDDVPSMNPAMLSGPPRRYYIQNQSIVLYPTPTTSGGSLKVRYYCRPGRLLDSATSTVGRTITAINTGTGVLTVGAGHTFTTSSIVDLIRGTPHFDHMALDLAVTATAATTITVSPASLPSDLVIGDTACQQYYSIFPQLPADIHIALAERTAARCLESLGDIKGAERLWGRAAEIQGAMISVVSPRVDGEQHFASQDPSTGILPSGPGYVPRGGWW